MGPNKLVVWLIVALVTLSLLTSAGPIIVMLAHAAVPLVIVVGLVTVVLRITWYFTSRY